MLRRDLWSFLQNALTMGDTTSQQRDLMPRCWRLLRAALKTLLSRLYSRQSQDLKHLPCC